MTRTATVARQTAVLTAGQFSGLAVSLVSTIIVTRALGPEGRAVYSWLLTLAGFATQIALLAPPAAVRVFATEDRPHLPGTLTVLCWLGALGTVPLVIPVLTNPTIGASSRPYLELAWLAVPLTATAQSVNTIVHIRGRAGQILAVQAGPRILQVAVALLLFGLDRLDLGTAIGLFVATAGSEVLLAFGFSARRPTDLRPSGALLRDFVRSVGIGWVSALAIFAVPRVGLIVLGTHAPLEITGRYSVALSLQEAALVAPVALGGVLITHLGRHGAGPGLAAKFLLLAGGALACGLAGLVAPFFIALAFGADFSSAAGTFRSLVWAALAVTIYQFCQPLLYRRGSAGAVALPALGAFAVALAIALVAIPRVGAAGAVLSNLLGFAALALLALLTVSRLPPATAPTA